MVDTASVMKFFTSNMKNKSVATKQGSLAGMAENAKENNMTAFTAGYFANRCVVSVDICNKEASVIKFTYADNTLSNPFAETIIVSCTAVPYTRAIFFFSLRVVWITARFKKLFAEARSCPYLLLLRANRVVDTHLKLVVT